MDPVVESALISAAATLVGVGGTAAVAIAGFRFSRRTLDDTRDGQIADRYTKAIEQLGSEELDVRIGGIYALERIARDSARDHPTVMEVLTTFIRAHSHEQWSPPEPDDLTQKTRWTRPDVQAAATVIGRRNAKRDIRAPELYSASLTRADLRRANLSGADLSGANLHRANLAEADLSDANLRGVRLTNADLTDAYLAEADLRGAHLGAALLQGTILLRARLGGADLTDTDVASALIDGADLASARWPSAAPPPEGWKPNTGSGRLERASTPSDPTEANQG
jgi:hypothetical protein